MYIKEVYRVNIMTMALLFIITSMALSVFIKIVKFGKKIQKRVVTSMW